MDRTVQERTGMADELDVDRRTGPERRKTERKRVAPGTKVSLWVEAKGGGWTRVEADVADRSSLGAGLLLSFELAPGQALMLEGDGFSGGSGGRQKGNVTWCRATVDGRYRAGVELAGSGQSGVKVDENFVDFYEVMELSPSASMETIHRIYRILAQRLHPDNTETGSAEAFKTLVQAYKVLADPEQRAAFDASRGVRQQVHWRVFDQNSATPSVEQEQLKRKGVLKALYLKRLREPENPGMNMIEMEALLGTPREHLDFSMWFLKENGWVTRTDNGRYSITVKGVEQAERQKVWEPSGRTEHLQLEPAY